MSSNPSARKHRHTHPRQNAAPSDLPGRYGKIGISAVAAACRYPSIVARSRPAAEDKDKDWQVLERLREDVLA